MFVDTIPFFLTTIKDQQKNYKSHTIYVYCS